jgi:hypothetical protein
MDWGPVLRKSDREKLPQTGRFSHETTAADDPAPQVGYGGALTLSGTVSSGLAGKTVNIDAMPCGATTFTRVASVKSVAQGAWSSPAKAGTAPTMITSAGFRAPRCPRRIGIGREG